jgi:hypothetical protein
MYFVNSNPISFAVWEVPTQEYDRESAVILLYTRASEKTHIPSLDYDLEFLQNAIIQERIEDFCLG